MIPKNKYRTHTAGELSAQNTGTEVVLSGWVHRKRDHGALLFIDLRDNYGITQCVFDTTNPAFASAPDIHPESVIRVSGTVVARASDAVNPKIPTGEIEVKVSTFDVLSDAAPLPFQVFGEEETNEELRLKHRYLDLRRERMHKNILFYNRVMKFTRDKMWEYGFSEFQTPILGATSPEGARDFIVPSRLHHGMFYALPQAPQQWKQLTQIAGFDRYFQIAPCFRDEDLRADRLLEFYQLDLEMSFVELRDIQAIGDKLMPGIVRHFVPDANVAADIPHITFADALMKYGTDKPDLRIPFIITDVSEIFRGSEFGIFADAVANGNVVRAIPAPATMEKPRSWFDKMGEYATNELGLSGLAYITFTADGAKGPVAKKLSESHIAAIKTATGVADGDTVFFVCSDKNTAWKAAGKIRSRLGAELCELNPHDFRFCWVEDFPFFEEDEESPTGIAFTHNPFSYPIATLAELNTRDPLTITAAQFDMVLNGNELCSGGLRNTNREIMLKCFEITGYTEEQVESQFTGMYTAFKYGAPPHGGCAFGLARLIMLMLGEDNMRQIIAWPTNQRGQDLMMGAPNTASEKQLREVHIKIRD